ncbi:MAG: CPBP family glutamic-type intramembrane protease [Bacteroidota bacterium]
MLKEFLAVSSYPELNRDRSFQSKLILLLQIYGIIFLLNMLTAPIAYGADYFVTHVLRYKSISKQYQESLFRMFQKFGYLKAVFYISIMAPVIEEAIFRLPLTFKRQHIAIAFGFALVLIAKLVPGLANQSLFINILARIAMFGIGYFIITQLTPALKTPGKYFQTILIITSIIVFGLMHILNYIPLHWDIVIIYPLYVIPQLIMGWALTYVRFKNGYLWGMGLHALINGVSMLIYTLFRHKL